MHEQAHSPYQDGSQTPWTFEAQDQRNVSGSVVQSLPFQAGSEDSQDSSVDQPYFPTADEAVDLNKQAIGQYHEIFGDSPEWGGVLKPNELESAIGSARNHYAYDPEPDDAARYTQAAAKQAWRIAGNQCFANGNKRVAYGLTQHMLDQNGLGHLSPIDQPDPEFVDHLIAQDSYSGDPGDRQRLENEYLNMWQQRYRQGGVTPGYQQRYPEGTYISDPQEAQTQNLQGFARRSNILDDIYNELSPLVFDNPASEKPILKPNHAHWIKKEIYATLDAAGYTDVSTWLSLVLTGSICTYQYSDSSDIDVSLFIDSRVFPEWSRAEMIALMVDKMDGRVLPGTQFPMQDFVVGEGIKPSDLYKPGLRSGYNIDNGKWIVPPERNRVYDVKATEGGFYAFALQQADKMSTLLRYEPDKAIMLWHQIHKKRQRDMKAGKTDAAESNLVYKFLFKRGLIPQIADYSGEYIAKTADEPIKPPHLREATSDKKYCGNCDEFKKGHCEMFGGYKVREDQVCDDWESKKHKSKAAAALGVGEGTYWHVSPKEFRPDIEATGLKRGALNTGEGIHSPEEKARLGLPDQPPSVYLFDHEDAAREWYDPNTDDLWSVDATGLPLHGDAYGINAVRHEGDIEGGRIKRIAKTAAPFDRQVAKFIYDPKANHLLLGQMGREEGENRTHNQLRGHPVWGEGLPPQTTWGTIGRNGYAEAYGGNNYHEGYKTEEAVRRAIPGTKFTNPREMLHPEWAIDDPKVTYVGEPPTIQPAEEEDKRWDFQAKVDLNQVAQRIYEGVKNGAGATLNLHGEGPHTRYGFAPDLTTQTPIPLETFSPKDVLDFIGRFSDRLADPEKFVGSWVQGDQVILDVSEGHDDFDTAHQRAWDGHQLAMYDATNEEDVPVRGLDYVQPTEAKMSATTIQVGQQYVQIFKGKNVIRRVRIIAIDGPIVQVVGLNGDMAGVEYPLNLESGRDSLLTEQELFARENTIPSVP